MIVGLLPHQDFRLPFLPCDILLQALLLHFCTLLLHILTSQHSTVLHSAFLLVLGAFHLLTFLCTAPPQSVVVLCFTLHSDDPEITGSHPGCWGPGRLVIDGKTLVSTGFSDTSQSTLLYKSVHHCIVLYITSLNCSIVLVST